MTTSTKQQAHRQEISRVASENREKLIAAARHVFAEHGLEIGVDEIARAAGVGIGTLYRRFPTKDALITELVRELVGDLMAEAQAALDEPEGRGLERFLYAAGQIQADARGCLGRMWSDDGTARLRQDYRETVKVLLHDAQREGRIRPDASLTDVDVLFWSLRGIIEVTGADSTRAWRRQIEISIAGLRSAASPLHEPAVSEAQVQATRVARRSS
ncbi:MAG: TetR family transcriptional regulator [Frondihabitans sp.]|nr:TetR family transcriptional regulator [Frondihabitans sp.]